MKKKENDFKTIRIYGHNYKLLKYESIEREMTMQNIINELVFKKFSKKYKDKIKLD